MRKAQFATAAPRNYLQKGHSDATSQCNAATSLVLTQIIISHILLKQTQIPAQAAAVDGQISCTITSHSMRDEKVLRGKVKHFLTGVL